jgi:hypothetical protein
MCSGNYNVLPNRLSILPNLNPMEIIHKFLVKSILAICFIAMISACNRFDETELIINEQMVCLKVGNKATRADLEKIAADLLVRKNIAVDFSNSEFTKGGRIKTLDLKVDCRDGFSGECNAPVSSLFVGGRYGFRRNYSPGAAVPLELCSMD